MKAEWSKTEINDIPVLVSDGNIDHKYTPKGGYKYGVRHDDMWNDPATVEPTVRVNYHSTVISAEPLLEMGEDNSCNELELDEYDASGITMALEEPEEECIEDSEENLQEWVDEERGLLGYMILFFTGDPE